MPHKEQRPNQDNNLFNRREIKVLIVDDSPLQCEILKDIITAAPGMKVAATTTDSREALKLANELKPDVITLDIEMPHVSGLEVLESLIESNPIPVVMVSALATRSADVTLRALDKGAVEYIGKPSHNSLNDQTFADDLLKKLRSASTCNVRRIIEIRTSRKSRMQSVLSPAPPTSMPLEFRKSCIAIGISTGGPPALSSIFEHLQPPLPPIVIVQHMPAEYTGSFAKRLDSISPLDVVEASNGMLLACNTVYVAPGGKHTSIDRLGGNMKLRVFDGDLVSGHRPSVDVMMTSAAKVFGNRCLGIIMTGMGFDGAEGCHEVKAAGGYVLGQDQESSAVYGMNKVAFQQGDVDEQFSLEHASDKIFATAHDFLLRRKVGQKA